MWQRGSEQRRQIDQMQRNIDPDYSIWNSYAPEPFKRQVSEQDSPAKQINWPTSKIINLRLKRRTMALLKKPLTQLKISLVMKSSLRTKPLKNNLSNLLKNRMPIFKVNPRYKVWPLS